MKNRPLIAVTGGYDTKTGQYYLKHEYMQAIRLAGGVPVLVEMPISAPEEWSGDREELIRLMDAQTEVLDRVDGVLFSGGPDLDPGFYKEPVFPENGEMEPLRDAFEIAFCREAVKRDLPCLGLCRGIQLMAVASGGKLIQDVYGRKGRGMREGTLIQHQQKAPTWYPTHRVFTEEGSLLREIAGESFWVNSFHHQAVAKERISGEVHSEEINSLPFTVTAYSTDGVVEGIERPELSFFVGLQWHAERMDKDPVQRAFFDRLVAEAKNYRDRKGA